MLVTTIPAYTQLYASPIGDITITATAQGVTHVSFTTQVVTYSTASIQPNVHTMHCVAELEQYFAGTLTQFTTTIVPTGTAFQLQVWNQLVQVPYGHTITYGTQAIRYGNAKAIRATASANGSNPIALLLPCHRVVGKSGKLTGYAGALWRKQWLLTHEARYIGAELGLV